MVQGGDGPGLRVGGRVDAARDACLMHEARAHGARLERDVERPTASILGRSRQSCVLGVRPAGSLVMPDRRDLAVDEPRAA